MIEDTLSKNESNRLKGNVCSLYKQQWLILIINIQIFYKLLRKNKQSKYKTGPSVKKCNSHGGMTLSTGR